MSTETTPILLTRGRGRVGWGFKFIQNMKTQYDTEQAALGAIRQAIKKASQLTDVLFNLRDDRTKNAETMPKVRAILAELNQRVHEFNAYNNVARGPGVEAVEQGA